MEKFGVENLKKIIAVPVEMGNVADAIGKENSSSWKKWFKLIELTDEVGSLLTVEWKMLKDEYLDFSDAEREEIKEFMKKKFDIADDKLENIIERSFTILFSVEGAIKDSIALYREIER